MIAMGVLLVVGVGILVGYKKLTRFLKNQGFAEYGESLIATSARHYSAVIAQTQLGDDNLLFC